MDERLPRRSPLGLIVLWMLYDGPKHVYGIQKLMHAQGKDRIVNVNSRASLYQTIERLARYELVVVNETVRSERYPERVLYELTETGREVARLWLREMLSTTEGEYPDFIVAVSILFGLPPEGAQSELELRADKLAAALAETTSALSNIPPGLPRLFLLEDEYRKTMLQAELTWVRGVIDDLREGRLTWSEDWIREIAAAFPEATQQPDPEETAG
jgi:DNA-binding PadR family transcriptional regulator